MAQAGHDRPEWKRPETIQAEKAAAERERELNKLGAAQKCAEYARIRQDDRDLFQWFQDNDGRLHMLGSPQAIHNFKFCLTREGYSLK